jgi:hypothetical protein
VRLKRKYQAVIVAVMIVMTALLSMIVVDSVQGSRVAYVAVRADQSSFEMGENVTFHLVPLTQGVEFAVNGTLEGGGIHVVRLPDDIDPDEFIEDEDAISEMYSWAYQRSMSEPIALPEFNSSGEPLEMVWNGSLARYDGMTAGLVWSKATEGNYLLFPTYNWQSGHATKFMLERASIFHYDSLRVDFNITYLNGEFTVRTDLSLPDGAAPMDGAFSAQLPYSDPYDGTPVYHHQNVSLRAGEVTSVTVTYPSTSMNYPSTYTEDTYPTTYLNADLRVGDDLYYFGFWQTVVYEPNGKGEVSHVQF